MFFFNKIGHAGTLDPIAEGLLIVLLNKAVKLSQYFLSLDKEYVTRIRLGITTDTYDLDGNIIGKSLVPRIDDDYLAGLIKSFKGFYKQKIPVFSAKKLKGKHLYDYARKNIETVKIENNVMINDISLLKFDTPDIYLRLSVSSGTYIRAIANDIGEKIGCGASVVELKRIRIGNFDIRDSLCLEDLVLIFKNMQTERNFLDDKNYINYIKSLIPIEKLLEDKKIIYIKEKYVKILETNSPLYPEMIDEKSIKTNKINLFKAGEIIILKANGEKKLYYHRVLSDFDLNELRKERQKLTKYLPLD